MTMPLFTILRNCNVYAPAPLGQKDILFSKNKICMIEDDLSRFCKYEGAETLDMENSIVCPGLIDVHIHATGGGGEQGPSSRVPEIKASEVFESGVTTMLSLLGTDGVSRSLENLLFKCRALEEEGITTLMLTGNYRYPSPTLTGDVQRDIALIDKIIGVKIAISDHRGSCLTGDELIRLGSEARIGGMLSGKPGLVVLHTGAADSRLDPLFYVLAHSPLPASNFLPTHCCRTPALVADAVRFNKMGGTIDFTADDCDSKTGTAPAVSSAVRQGADVSRITVSSDGCGSQPLFDANGNCIGLSYSTPKTLLCELSRLVKNEKLPLETALRFFTQNPAHVLGLEGKKGVLAIGSDADIAVLDDNFALRSLFAGGKKAIIDRQILMKGRFER